MFSGWYFKNTSQFKFMCKSVLTQDLRWPRKKSQRPVQCLLCQWGNFLQRSIKSGTKCLENVLSCPHFSCPHLSDSRHSGWSATLQSVEDPLTVFQPSNSPAVFVRRAAWLMFRFSSLFSHISFGQSPVLLFTVALSARVTHHNSESGGLWVPLQATVNSQVIELLLCCVW